MNPMPPSSEPVRAADGTVLYWIWVNLDIDERKQAELYLAEDSGLPIQAAGHLPLLGSSIDLRSCFSESVARSKRQGDRHRKSIWPWCIRKVGYSSSNKFKRPWRRIEHSTSRSEYCQFPDRFEASIAWDSC